uniref:Uncharacterized protein n=1 Tax=Sus scrofa TaxID=9823 RepID=A0A8D0Q6R3_PIG
MAAHLKKRVYEEFTKVVQQQQEEIATKKLRLTKPSKSAALHIDLCKATSPADALQYLLQFARKPVEAESPAVRMYGNMCKSCITSENELIFQNN